MINFFYRNNFISEHANLTTANNSKDNTAANTPYISKVSDKLSCSSNIIKIGFLMEILGENLKFNPNDKEQGIFAITKNKEIKFKHVIENKLSKLVVFLDPEIPPGEFSLEVRTKMDKNGVRQLKTLKKGLYNKNLQAVI